MKRFVLAATAALVFGPMAQAQTTAPAAPAAAIKVPATATVAIAGAAKAVPHHGPNCFRLPLSDVAFGTEGATRYAREKLDEYAAAEAKKRKWPAKPLSKSNETVSCEVYLNLGPLGTEYRCLVTTTFCQK